MNDSHEWWSKENTLDTVRLSAEEYFALVSWLDTAGRERRGPDQRGRARIRYRWRRTVVLIRHLNGSRVAYDVKPHNLSRTGIAFLHGFYVHPGTSCETALWTVDKEPVAIRGKIVRCRHLRGKTHEVGVQFDQPVDLRNFLSDYTPPDGEEPSGHGRPRFSGRVLYVDNSVDDRELVEFIAGELGVALHTAASAADALDWAGKSPCDLIITKLHLPGTDAVRLARALGDRGYAGRIVAIGSPGARGATVPADEPAPQLPPEYNRLLSPPITLERMAALFRDFLRCESDSGEPLEPLVSTHWSNVAMRPFILKFVARLEGHVARLEELAGGEQLDDFRQACHDFMGSAESYGYHQIAAALRKLDAQAANDMRAESVRPRLTELARLCAAASRARAGIGRSVRPE